jgi:hypothetical protein
MQWIHVHRYLRETLALTGFLLVFVGLFGSPAETDAFQLQALFCL